MYVCLKNTAKSSWFVTHNLCLSYNLTNYRWISECRKYSFFFLIPANDFYCSCFTYTSYLLCLTNLFLLNLFSGGIQLSWRLVCWQKPLFRRRKHKRIQKRRKIPLLFEEQRWRPLHRSLDNCRVQHSKNSREKPRKAAYNACQSGSGWTWL